MPKTFNFNLESVRALREQAEQQAQEQLANELALQARRERALKDASLRAAAARRARAPRHGASVTGHELQARDAFVVRTEREHDAARHELTTSEQQVETSRGRLVEAGRDREVLERLKRRRASEHAHEVARAEEQTLAEVALTTHLRNRRNAA
ncbi:MAG TPA: flagellar export protein FliJ [Gaiellales bacterium]|jgi:flagellar FliJ protein